MSLLHPPRCRCVLVIVVLSLFGLLGKPLLATPYISSHGFDLSTTLPPPPAEGSQQYLTDLGYLRDARAASTQAQMDQALAASHDSVFDYSQTLGSWFNSRNLPKTAAVFDKVDRETKSAIEYAKNSFARERPSTWKETGDSEKNNGYSYPSGHSTRAFLWSNLLANAFPEEQKALHLQARQKCWYRVILGRHYPADVRAGKLYGQFLAAQFLKSPEFLKEWPAACAEMREARRKATSHS